jgi:hypothetical protein
MALFVAIVSRLVLTAFFFPEDASSEKAIVVPPKAKKIARRFAVKQAIEGGRLADEDYELY